MELFLRTTAIYLFLLVLFRLLGKRTLSELSTFDFILVLIISEATQNALLGENYSVAAGFAVILTLVLLDLGLSIIKQRSKVIEKITEGTPLVLVDHGRVLSERLALSHVTEDDIMHSARQSQGIERMDQIKFAVLEPSGGISVIPQSTNITERLEQKLDTLLARAAKPTPG